MDMKEKINCIFGREKVLQNILSTKIPWTFAMHVDVCELRYDERKKSWTKAFLPSLFSELCVYDIMHIS